MYTCIYICVLYVYHMYTCINMCIFTSRIWGPNSDFIWRNVNGVKHDTCRYNVACNMAVINAYMNTQCTYGTYTCIIHKINVCMQELKVHVRVVIIQNVLPAWL